MTRALKYAIMAIVAIVLLVLALANRELVTLRLVPSDTGSFMGWDWSLKLPLFLVILLSILVGLGLGFLWEWMREAKHRRAAAHHAREARSLKSEMSGLRRETNRPKDDVLALLENSGKPKTPARSTTLPAQR